MSLLMDALRKAEQQKQLGGGTPEQPNTTGLSLEPLPTSDETPAPSPSPAENLRAGSRPLPELPKRLEELDEQFFTTDSPVRKTGRMPADATSRDAAQGTFPRQVDDTEVRAAARNVFSVKQPATSATRPGFATTVSVATLVAMGVIGAYFYWQLQPAGGLRTSPLVASTPTPIPPPEPATASPVATSPASPTLSRPEPRAQDASPTAIFRADKPAASTTGAAPRAHEPSRPGVKTEPVALPAIPVASAPTNGNPDLSIRFSSRPKKLDGSQDGETAQAAFQRGDVELARALWANMLQADPRGIGAMHGLASLALREGKTDQAARLYRRILEIDPKDAPAHAGLLSLSTPSDPRQAESRLKSLLAEQPESPPLHFALGNLQAAEARWSDAQQSYFKAHAGEPGNPDYLYNLAVSLDHLHQPRLAIQYYARALAAAQTQSAAFDMHQAEARMKALDALRGE